MVEATLEAALGVFQPVPQEAIAPFRLLYANASFSDCNVIIIRHRKGKEERCDRFFVIHFVPSLSHFVSHYGKCIAESKSYMERMKKKVNGHRKRKWLKPINWNGYLGVVILTVSITILLPILLAVGQPVVHSTPEKRANEVLMAQEETKAPQPEEIKKQTETKPSQELPQKQKESANEAESPQKQAEPTTGEKPTAEQGKSATGEKPTAEQGESATGEKPTAEQKVSLEEEKKSLGKEINERYEEWEAQRTNSQTWHSASAIATILLTTGITLFGTGLFEFPYKKLIIFILGIIAVLIQFNVNVFLLEKSIGGYKILEEQGSLLKNKLESVRTDNELSEVREQFRALILESQNIE